MINKTSKKKEIQQSPDSTPNQPRNYFLNPKSEKQKIEMEESHQLSAQLKKIAQRIV
jgi:hypothetical protein